MRMSLTGVGLTEMRLRYIGETRSGSGSTGTALASAVRMGSIATSHGMGSTSAVGSGSGLTGAEMGLMGTGTAGTALENAGGVASVAASLRLRLTGLGLGSMGAVRTGPTVTSLWTRLVGAGSVGA